MAWGPWEGSTVFTLICCITIAIGSAVLLTTHQQKNNQKKNKKNEQEDNHMRFQNKSLFVTPTPFMLFVAALLIGLIAYWQVGVVAIIGLILLVVLRYSKFSSLSK